MTSCLHTAQEGIAYSQFCEEWSHYKAHAMPFARLSLQDQKTKTNPALQSAQMATREDNGATVIATHLKPHTMDRSVEDVNKEFTPFKTLAKLWFKTKVITDHKYYMFTLQLVDKEGICNTTDPLMSVLYGSIDSSS